MAESYGMNSENVSLIHIWDAIGNNAISDGNRIARFVALST